MGWLCRAFSLPDKPCKPFGMLDKADQRLTPAGARQARPFTIAADHLPGGAHGTGSTEPDDGETRIETCKGWHGSGGFSLPDSIPLLRLRNFASSGIARASDTQEFPVMIVRRSGGRLSQSEWQDRVAS
jgi:hypothetical protein